MYRGDNLSMVKIRFRTDGAAEADDKARMMREEPTIYYSEEELRDVEAALPGDCWLVRWHKVGDVPGPVAGYAICCPKCGQVHWWTMAKNCAEKAPGSDYCVHNGKGSCWKWTGSAQDGTLSATPSLHAINEANGLSGKKGHGCGWHGWLTNGFLRA